MRRLLVSFLAVATLGGCAIGYDVTYDSFPQSARVICADGEKGLTPLTLTYMPTDREVATGVMAVAPCYAQWVSGAKAGYTNTVRVPKSVLTTAVLKVNRPNHSNLQADVTYDAEVKAQIARERALELQEQQLMHLRQMERRQFEATHRPPHNAPRPNLGKKGPNVKPQPPAAHGKMPSSSNAKQPRPPVAHQEKPMKKESRPVAAHKEQKPMNQPPRDKR